MSKMKKFYELRDDYDKLHIIIQKHGYGKTYYEKNKYKKELLNDIINKIKHEIVSNCIDDEDKVKLLTIIERVRWDIMKETYDIIIEKLEQDKLSFDREISEVIDYVEYDSIAKLDYDRAKAKRDYCMDLIEFCKEVRSNL